MPTSNIYPIVLCNAEYTQPSSDPNTALPQQFVSIEGGLSPLQSVVKRISDFGFAEPLIIADEAFRQVVSEQMRAIGAENAIIMLVPQNRDSAPAVCAAAEFLHLQDDDALMWVTPWNSVFEDQPTMSLTVDSCSDWAMGGYNVAFGIRPEYAESNCGYFELSDSEGAENTPQRYLQLVERPNQQDAEDMCNSQRFVLISGMFLLSAGSVLHLFEKHEPELRSHIRLAVKAMKYGVDFVQLGERYGEVPEISFESAIMQRETGFVVPMSRAATPAQWTNDANDLLSA